MVATINAPMIGAKRFAMSCSMPSACPVDRPPGAGRVPTTHAPAPRSLIRVARPPAFARDARPCTADDDRKPSTWFRPSPEDDAGEWPGCTGESTRNRHAWCAKCSEWPSKSGEPRPSAAKIVPPPVPRIHPLIRAHIRYALSSWGVAPEPDAAHRPGAADT